MRAVRIDGSTLRYVSSLGFNVARQGAMISGRTGDHEIVVIVYWAAIRRWFPSIVSSEACVAFVERNLEPLRGIIERELISGKSTRLPSHAGRREAALFVELGPVEIERSRRWLLQ
jgi:hypothetical protein